MGDRKDILCSCSATCEIICGLHPTGVHVTYFLSLFITFWTLQAKRAEIGMEMKLAIFPGLDVVLQLMGRDTEKEYIESCV